MSDFIRSIQAYLYQRVSNPLFGAFAAAWLIVNYRIFFMLFSGDHYSENFAALNSHFHFDLFAQFWIPDSVGGILGRLTKGLIFPFLIAYLYLWLHPKISQPVARMVHKGRMELRKIQQDAEEQELLTVEESLELKNRLFKAEKEHLQEVQALRDELEEKEADLKRSLSDLRNSDGYKLQLEDSNKTVQILEAELNSLKAEPLKRRDKKTPLEFRIRSRGVTQLFEISDEELDAIRYIRSALENSREQANARPEGVSLSTYVQAMDQIHGDGASLTSQMIVEQLEGYVSAMIGGARTDSFFSPSSLVGVEAASGFGENEINFLRRLGDEINLRHKIGQ